MTEEAQAKTSEPNANDDQKTAAKIREVANRLNKEIYAASENGIAVELRAVDVTLAQDQLERSVLMVKIYKVL
jgi:hypothetical protein